MEKEYSWIYQIYEFSRTYYAYRIKDGKFDSTAGLLVLRKKITEGTLSKKFMIFRKWYLNFIDSKVAEINKIERDKQHKKWDRLLLWNRFNDWIWNKKK